MIARGYAEMVVDGRVPGCRYVVLACQRFLDMWEKAQDPANPYYFSDAHAVDYCAFLETLRHVETGMWEIHQDHDRVILEPWQIFCEVAIHGFRWRSDDQRVVTRAYEEVPRKNVKTFRLSGAALFDLCFSGQKSPQVTIAASNEKQADIPFAPVVKQLKQDDELIDRFDIKISQKMIRNQKNDGSVFKLTAQGEKQDGLNPSLAIMEELHAMRQVVYDVINSAFGARPNALMRMITTGGHSTAGLAYSVRQDMINVLEGLNNDPTVFAIIYTLDEEDYLTAEGGLKVKEVLSNPQLVAKANPMLGVSLDPRKVHSFLQEAQRAPDKQGEALRTRFNLWGHTGKALVNPSSWAACMDRSLNLVDFMGQRCWVGVDLGLKDDFTSVALLFERGEDLVVFTKYWVSELAPIFDDPVEGSRAMTWTREERDDGFALNTQPNMPVDPAPIAAELVSYADVFDLQSVIVDNYQAVSLLHTTADAGLPVMEMSNAAKMMTVPTHDILKRIRGNRIKHDGHPVLTWNVENVHGNEKGNGSIVPKKVTDTSMKKIDGFVAAVMANAARLGGGRPVGEGEVPFVSVYDSGGIIMGAGNAA